MSAQAWVIESVDLHEAHVLYLVPPFEGDDTLESWHYSIDAARTFGTREDAERRMAAVQGRFRRLRVVTPAQVLREKAAEIEHDTEYNYNRTLSWTPRRQANNNRRIAEARELRERADKLDGFNVVG